MVVDATKVASIGTPALQVLYAAGRELFAAGKGMTIANPSGPFQDAVQDLGLTADFDTWGAPG